MSVKDTILGRATFSHPVHIVNADEWDMIKSKTSCDEPPYPFPFVVHRISAVQPILPVKFLKLDSQVGRALYRPLPAEGETVTDEGTKDQQNTSSASTKNKHDKQEKAAPTASKEASADKAKQHTKQKDISTSSKPSKHDKPGQKEPAASKEASTHKAKQHTKQKEVSTSSQGEAKSLPKGKEKGKNNKCSKHSGIRLPSQDLLQGQRVKVMDPAAHLLPSQEREKERREWLKRKDRTPDVQISGGCLAHLNNFAFPRSPAFTFAFLLGVVESKIVVVKGMFAPQWEDQQNGHSDFFKAFDSEELKLLRESKEHDVVGCLIVKPAAESGEIFSTEDFALSAMFQQLTGPDFVTVLVGNDRRASFYQVTQEGLAAFEKGESQVHTDYVATLEPDVLWTGTKSLYYAKLLTHEISEFETFKEDAAKAIKKAANKLNPKDQKAANNESRRAQNLLSRDALSVTAYKEVEKELGILAENLIENMGAFATDLNAAQEAFKNAASQLPLATKALEEANLKQVPGSPTEAGQLLASIMSLKMKANGRTLNRSSNFDHTFNGQKYAKRRRCGFSSSTSSKAMSAPSGSESSTYPNSSSQLDKDRLVSGRSNDIHIYIYMFIFFG